MGLVCLVYFLSLQRRHYASGPLCTWGCHVLTFQLSDSHDFSMFHILPYLCFWTLWEKVCNVCVQLRTEGGLGLSNAVPL